MTSDNHPFFEHVRNHWSLFALPLALSALMAALMIISLFVLEEGSASFVVAVINLFALSFLIILIGIIIVVARMMND